MPVRETTYTEYVCKRVGRGQSRVEDAKGQKRQQGGKEVRKQESI